MIGRCFQALYRAGLRLTPPDFRRRYGREALDVAAKRVSARARWQQPVAAIRELVDLLATARRERRARASATRHPRVPLVTFDSLRQDLRLAIRSLRTAPGFTSVALIILTLGIGANTAIFSVVDAVVFRDLPYDRADRIVAVKETARAQLTDCPPPDFLDWRERQDIFEAIAGSVSASSPFVLPAGDRAERRLRVTQTSADLFAVLGVQPRLGRAFSRDNEIEGRQQVAIISDAFWREQFGANPDVIGQQLRLTNGVLEIVGVMPPGFTYPLGVAPMDMWVPYAMSAAEKMRRPTHNSYVRVVARLKPEVTVAQAASRMGLIQTGMSVQDPAWFKGHDVVVLSLKEAAVGVSVRRWLLTLLGAAGCVLLIACVNVASLLMARATVRRREIGIRVALGASRWQLARALLVESLLLTTIATALGAGLAVWGVEFVRSSLPAGLFRADAIAVDSRVLFTAIAVAVATAACMSLAPAFALSRRDLTSSVREGGREGTAGAPRQRARTALVIAEVMLAVPLVIGAGLFLSSFARLMRIDVGLDYHDVTTVSFRPRVSSRPSLKDAPVPPDLAQAAADLSAMVERVRAIPGVEAVSGLDCCLPLSDVEFRTAATVPGQPDVFPDGITLYHVTREYPATLRIPVLRGRLFTDDEDRPGGARVVLLNDVAAARLTRGDALGSIVTIDGDRTVVGIVGNTRIGGPESRLRPEAYVPLSHVGLQSGYLLVRSRVSRPVLARSIADIGAEVSPTSTLGTVSTLDDVFSRLVAERRLSLLLFGLFGVLALAIASVGIYGVLAYLVHQRTKEIGVRMALGATRARIVQSVLGRSVVVVGAGLVLGLMTAWMLARFVAGFLFEVPAHDLIVYASVTIVLAAAGLLAALVPARRAASVDPLIALRME